MRRGQECPRSMSRDIVRGVMEDIIGPRVQTHRRGGTGERHTEHGAER